MQVSVNATLDEKRAHYTIGRVSAHSSWRAAEGELADLDREVALRALVREAEEYGADGVVEVACAGVDVEDHPSKTLGAGEGDRLPDTFRRLLGADRAPDRNAEELKVLGRRRDRPDEARAHQGEGDRMNESDESAHGRVPWRFSAWFAEPEGAWGIIVSPGTLPGLPGGR